LPAPVALVPAVAAAWPMATKMAAVPQAPLPRVKKSGRWKLRIIEKCRPVRPWGASMNTG
jgi:hypothetical protein